MPRAQTAFCTFFAHLFTVCFTENGWLLTPASTRWMLDWLKCRKEMPLAWCGWKREGLFRCPRTSLRLRPDSTNGSFSYQRGGLCIEAQRCVLRSAWLSGPRTIMEHHRLVTGARPLQWITWTFQWGLISPRALKTPPVHSVPDLSRRARGPGKLVLALNGYEFSRIQTFAPPKLKLCTDDTLAYFPLSDILVLSLFRENACSRSFGSPVCL